MKRAKQGWHTRQNCMVRSRVAFVRQTIRNSLDRFVGVKLTSDIKNEIEDEIRKSIEAVTTQYHRVIRAERVGDQLEVDFQLYPPCININLSAAIASAS